MRRDEGRAKSRERERERERLVGPFLEDVVVS